MHGVRAAVAAARDLGRGAGAGGRRSSASPRCLPKACKSIRLTAPRRRCLSAPSAATRSCGETRTRTAEGGGVCVGRPVAGNDRQDHPHQRRADRDLERRPGGSRGEIGEIVVQGPVVTRVVLQSSGVDGAGEDRRSRRRLLASHGRCRLFGSIKAASGSAAASRSAS